MGGKGNYRDCKGINIAQNGIKYISRRELTSITDLFVRSPACPLSLAFDNGLLKGFDNVKSYYFHSNNGDET